MPLCRPGRVALSLLLALGLAACTPRVEPAGPVTTTPEITSEYLVMPDGARLPLHAWLPEGPPRAAILALHGFNDAAVNYMGMTAPMFTAAGIAVYAYDQRGFGAAPHPGVWAGGDSLVRDAVTAALLLQARHPEVPLWLMGESMGAAVAVLAGASPTPPPVAGYILSAPAFWSRKSMNGVMRSVLWLATHTMPIVGFRGTAGGIVASDNEAALLRWARDPLTLKVTRVDAAYGLVQLMDAAVAAVPQCCRAAGLAGPAPVLVLLGRKDALVPAAAARRALRDLPASAADRIAVYPNGYHLLLRDRDRAAVARDILAWMQQPAAPLPSGADQLGRAWLSERD